MIKNYSRHNFHSHTFCIWNEVPFAEITDLKINYTSQSGSQYIFTEKGLYRISNHWGRVANCHWRLIPLADFKNQNTTVAFADWTDFYSNDDSSRLFFIKVDFEKQEINFHHKLSAKAHEELVLRTAKEIAKTIKIIKEVIAETGWARYLHYDDINVLRKEIVTELVNTNRTFLEIKRKFQ